VNKLLFRELEALARKPVYTVGKDEKDFFNEHCFCKDKDGIVLDATPIYPFSGANHLPERTPHTWKDMPSMSLNNPLTVFYDDNGSYLINLMFDMPVLEGDKFTFAIYAKDMQFECGAKATLAADLSRFRQMIKDKYSYTDVDEMNSLANYLIGVDVIGNLKFQNSPTCPERHDIMVDVVCEQFYVAAAIIHKLAYMD